jgi:hypothetical protein
MPKATRHEARIYRDEQAEEDFFKAALTEHDLRFLNGVEEVETDAENSLHSPCIPNRWGIPRQA